MEYCSWSDNCEIYVYSSVYGGFVVRCNSINKWFHSREETLKELNRLRSLNVKVPPEVIDRFQEEINQHLQEPIWIE